MMKKVSFYSYHRKCGGRTALLHEGYDDGTFYYYNSKDGWYCIDKLSGLSVLKHSCSTKAEAYEEAHLNETMDLLSKVTHEEWYKNVVQEFAKARMEATMK